MTNTLRQAATLIADHARARRLRIDQVDPVLAESRDAIMFYAWASDDCLFALVDLPMTIDDEDAFSLDEWREAFHGLLPSDVLATRAPA